ncbi:MAG: M20/M25/M40 family metallo-hydrolase [Lachnospiraceae bacterium]|nr:M20/M25/M40 family metallo-hydrolase [Lachnospiraceae bacterium]
MICPIDVTANGPLVVFAAHLDVVFPDEEELPFREENGRIYAPGVGDDTANVCTLLLAARYAAEIYREKKEEQGLLFVFGVGEEGLGNLKGARQICRDFGSRITAYYALDLTMETYTAKAVGSLRYCITVTAKGGHSFSDFGNTSANAVLAKLICALYEQEVPDGGHTTYNVGVISGGTSVNTIAQKAEMLYEIRSDCREDLKKMEESFHACLKNLEDGRPEDCKLAAAQIGERPCEAEVDVQRRGELFAIVEKAVVDAGALKPKPVPCSTDCNIPLSLGIPAVCVGTCRGAGAHTREEYVERDSLKTGLCIALNLVDGYL